MFLHTLHLCTDLHCCLKCPPVIQFEQRFFALTAASLSTCGKSLNLAQTYSGCFSFLQRTQLEFALAVKEAILLGGCFFCGAHDILDACSHRSMNSIIFS